MSKSYPFINVKEFIFWANQNCAICCRAGTLAIPGSSTCEFFEAIASSMCVSKVDVPDEIAERLGQVGNGLFELCQQCPEREVSA